MIIGMLGLGSMGGAMARRALSQGHEVVGFDVAEAARARLEQAGGTCASSPRDVGDKAGIVIACLPSRAVCYDAAYGDDGAIHGSALELYVEMSTLGRAPLLAMDERFRAAGKGFLDCPISGGPHSAEEGRLTAIIAGPESDIAKVAPVLDALTANRFVVGAEAGMAQVCKLVNNILSITAMVTSCEAISMGVKAGLDAKTMIDVINVSTGRNSATLEKFPKAILPRTFDYGGPLTVGEKDVELYLELARDTGMPAFIGANVANLFHHLAAQLGEGADYSRIITVWEKWGNITVGGD